MLLIIYRLLLWQVPLQDSEWTIHPCNKRLCVHADKFSLSRSGTKNTPESICNVVLSQFQHMSQLSDVMQALCCHEVLLCPKIRIATPELLHISGDHGQVRERRLNKAHPGAASLGWWTLFSPLPTAIFTYSVCSPNPDSYTEFSSSDPSGLTQWEITIVYEI